MEKINEKSHQYILLNFFEKLKIKMCSQHQLLSLRPKLNLSEESNFEDDFDFIIKDEDFQGILNVIYELCKVSGVNFSLDQRMPTKKLFRFFIDDLENEKITIELWTAISFTINKSKYLFKSELIFKSINENKITEIEALSLLYITHLFHRNKDIGSKESLFRFDFFFQNLSEEKNIRFSNPTVCEILNQVKDNGISLKEANNKAIALLEEIGVESGTLKWNNVKNLHYRIRNKFLNLKIYTPIIGPDGVGKGSVSELALRDLNNWDFFPFRLLYKIKYLYPFRLSLIPESKTEFRYILDEKISHYIFITAFISMRFLILFKPGKKILLDRYFMDFFAIPMRGLKEGEQPHKISFYKILMLLMPVPNYSVFLGCKNESLTARKNELPINAVGFLQKINCEIIAVKMLPQTLFISTENTLEISSKVLCDFLKKIK